MTVTYTDDEIYKEIIILKDRIASWDMSYDIFDAIVDGFVNPVLRNSDDITGIAARKIIKAGYLERGWNRKWHFNLPSTREAMECREDFDLTVHGLLYNGHRDFSECPMSKVTMDMKDLILNRKYDNTVPEYELFEDFMWKLLSYLT